MSSSYCCLTSYMVIAMRCLFRILLAVAAMIAGGVDAMAIEEAQYTLVKQEDRFEIRDYASHILAETVVEGDLEGAGNKAFNRLFQYISGNNRAQSRVEMTAPVSQQPEGKKIAMTAPVGQQRVQEKWSVSFMMPASYTLETLPQPLDPKVTLRELPSRRMAVVRYSGFWNEEGYLRNKSDLEFWIDRMGLAIIGEAVWARYNSPFSLWFLRRNEVLIPVATE